jgi:hypothetical protein
MARIGGREDPSALRLVAAQGLVLDHVLADVARAFDERGVRYLLLKGPAFARWLYDDPVARPYDDIDLLVEQGGLPSARRTLAELGFERRLAGMRSHERTTHHEHWVGARPVPAIVELHHTLALVEAPPSLVWDRLSAGAGTIGLAGATVTVPSGVGCTLIVALHVAQHGVSDAKHMEDLRRACERVDIQTWRAAAELAHELGADDLFAAGLRLDRGGRELADRLGLSSQTSRLVRLLTTTPPDTAMGIERLVSTHGVSARLRLIGRELAPSREFMYALHPSARGSRVGLLVAYLRRPFVLATQLPHGAMAWLRASRAAGRSGRRR